MNKGLSLAYAAVLLVLLSGCSSSRVDTSTPESTQKSLAAVQEGLSDEKREKFSEALGVVIANALGGGYRDVGDTPEGRDRVRQALSDKTADEIIAEAARIKQQSQLAKPPNS